MMEILLSGGSMGIGIKSYQRVLLNDVGATYGVGIHTIPISNIEASKSVIIGLKCNTGSTVSQTRGPAITGLTDSDFSFEVFNTGSSQSVAFEILELYGIQEVRRGYYREGDSLTDQLGPIDYPSETIVVPELMGNYIPANSGEGTPAYVASQNAYQMVSVSENGISMNPSSQLSTLPLVYVLLQAIII